jgi:glycosyltransferase involved in cell wall biosynthesis
MSNTLLSPRPASGTRLSADPQTAAATERILFVPEIVAFGGGERVYLALSRYLHGHGLPHRIVSYYQDIDLQDYADWPVPLEQLAPPRNPLSKARALGEYLRDRSRHYPNAPAPLLVGLQSAMHAAHGRAGNGSYSVMILDTPRLMGQSPVSRKNLPGWIRSAVSERYTRTGLQRARDVFITTDVMAREIDTLYGMRPAVIRQGIAPADVPVRAAAPSQTPFRFLSVCRLEASKRLDWILRALAAIEFSTQMIPQLGKHLDWHLDIVGTGSQEPYLKRLASEVGIAHRVTFHGPVSDPRLEELYASAHVFLMPAVQGYGLPALEALTRHVPLVMHRDSGVSEILGGSPWVEMIDGTDEHELVRGINAMVTRLLGGAPDPAALPSFPSESDWAAEVCRRCGWL